MANGKRNKITKPGKATRENRMVLFMLFQIFNFSDSEDQAVRQQLATIFIALYDDFKEYNFYNLYDRNVQRLKSGHQNADWKAIDRPNEWNNTTWDANELAHFDTLRGNILREAARLGIQISYKANPERKHQPLIPGHVPAPAAITAATNSQAPAPAQTQAPPSTNLHSTAITTAAAHSQVLSATGYGTQPGSYSTNTRNGNEEESSENEGDHSDSEDGSRGYEDNSDRLQCMNYTDSAVGDESDDDHNDNVIWSDDIAPGTNFGRDTAVNARRSRFMSVRYESEEESLDDLSSEDDSEEEDITWTIRNTLRGRLSSDELQERVISCMNAASEAESLEETVYGRESGGFLTPSWVVTEEMVQEEMKKLQDSEKKETDKLNHDQGSHGSLFSGELAMLTAEASGTDIEKMLAHFAQTGRA